MAQKRSQPFRFRIPWFSSRPAAEQLPRRPKDGTQSASQSDNAVPVQRPPFKPPGKAPPQPQSQTPPKQVQGAPRTEPQPQSPSHTPPRRITSSSVAIESPSASRSTNQIPVNSSLPSSPSQSPSPAGPRASPIVVKSQPASEPQPPPHLASEQRREVLKPVPEETTKPALSPSLSRGSSRAASVTSSPISKTRDASQPQFPSHVSSEQPRELLEPKTEEKTQQSGPEESTKPALSPSPSRRQASSISSSPISKAQPASKPQSPSQLASEPPKEVLKPATEEISQPAVISTSPLPSLAGSQSQASSPISKTQPHSPSHSASDFPGKQLKPTAEERASPTPSSPISETQELQSLSPLKPAAEEITQPALSPSPSRGDSQQRASSKPSSPISKTQPASKPQSPSPTKEALKPPAEESTQPASPALKQKEKLELSEPVSQESKPNTNSPLKIIPKSHEHIPPDTSPKQPLRMLGNEEGSAPTSTTDAALETPATAKKLESERINGNSKSPPKTQSKSLLPSKEKEKAVQEPVKEGKTKAATIQKPVRRRTTEAQATASTSGTKAKDPTTRAFQADKKQQPQAQQTVERRMMFATASPTGQDTKVVSSADPSTRSISSSSIFPQKAVLSQGEKAPLQKEIKEDISKFIEKVATSTESIDDIDTAFSVITLAGDNRGATMHIGLDSAKKEESVPIYRAYKTNPEERITTTDEEETSDHNSVNEDEEAGRAYVNSNIQSLNNSLMFHGSVNERDPGVKLTLPEKSDDNKQGRTCKNEFKVFRSERLNYQPTVRRRCLRGLFLEPSDSDPDNPEKPRRHGCKFRCPDIGKDKDAEIM